VAKQADAKLWNKLKPAARRFRHEPTEAEDKLWHQLRGKQLHNVKFRRQHTIDRYIVDFYCEQFRLIIEVDGDIHLYQQQADEIRQQHLETLGLRILRFSNEQVLTNIDSVLKTISLIVAPHA